MESPHRKYLSRAHAISWNIQILDQYGRLHRSAIAFQRVESMASCRTLFLITLCGGCPSIASCTDQKKRDVFLPSSTKVSSANLESSELGPSQEIVACAREYIAAICCTCHDFSPSSLWFMQTWSTLQNRTRLPSLSAIYFSTLPIFFYTY